MVNKKAFLFSLTALLFIFLFGLIIFSAYDLTSENSVFSVRPQVTAYQSYYESLKVSYIPVMIEISARKSLETLSNYSISTQTYIPPDNFTDIMRDLLANGSANDVIYPDFSVHTINSTNSINYSLGSQIDSMISIYKNAIIFESAILNITPLWNLLEINQSTAWHVDVILPFKMELTHPNFEFSDNFIPYVISVPIKNIPDPLLGIQSDTPFFKPIRNSTSVINNWSDSQLVDFVFNETFIQRDTGRSFLSRLQNASSGIYPDSSKITSFILPEYVNTSSGILFSYNATSDKRSFVDTFFFDNSFSNCDNGVSQEDFLYSITDITNETNSTFRLDFNSTIFFLGEDFYDSDEFFVSCFSGP